MAVLMSRRAYARHRGASPSSLRYAIRKGWVVPDPATGMIDLAQADAGWPLERRHGPMAWIMGPEPPGPPTELDNALMAGDLDKVLTLLEAEALPEPFTAEELAASLAELPDPP
jgi:hypothetical protein